MFKHRYGYKKIDADVLKQNILNAGYNIKGIQSLKDNWIDVYSDYQFSQAQIDHIQTEINSYTWTDPEMSRPKILDHVNEHLKHNDHKGIDYKTQLNTNLFPKRTITKGEVVKVDWYSDETLNDKVLTVNVEYNRDANGFAVDRTTVREWVNRDGTVNLDKKITHKNYSINHVDQIVEGIKRRKLLVNNMQMPTLYMMLEVLLPLGENQSLVLLKGREFLDRYELEFNKFVDNSSTVTDLADPDFGKKNVVVKLEDTDDTSGFNKDHNYWLDKKPGSLGGSVSIREYLISEFSI
jgi:hypothetical protein